MNDIAQEMLTTFSDDPDLLKKVIAGDESWVYGYDSETKAQSCQWKRPKEPRPKKARQVRSSVKVLLTVFFDCNGVEHHEILPQCRTVNKEYYVENMHRLRDAIRQKRTELWKNHGFCTMMTQQFLAKNKTLIMPQPRYSPDLAPAGLFTFPKLKTPM